MRPSSAVALAALLALVLLVPAGVGAATPTGIPAAYVQVSTAPPGAEVYVNGAKMSGVTPLTVRVPALEHEEIVVNLYGYEAARQTVMLQPEQTLPLHFDLRPLAGAAPITETPGGARSPAAPGGAGTSAPQEIWTEDAPLPGWAAVLALLGAGLLLRRR